ncbi:PCNA-associated factor isoform X3 [Columba livia]|uniref:PCNA-associated factor isoform X3 n=1 Tax=Columba livia TaxID=8932 RepID=UPI0031BB2A45
MPARSHWLALANGVWARALRGQDGAHEGGGRARAVPESSGRPRSPEGAGLHQPQCGTVAERQERARPPPPAPADDGESSEEELDLT